MKNKIIQLKNGQEAILAEYKEQQVPEYRGNPLIEALPPIFSGTEVGNRLTVYPNIDDNERDYPAEIRMHCIQRIFQYFQPFPTHLDLERRLSRIIRQGYLSRNILSPEYTRSLVEGHEAILAKNLHNSSQTIKTTSSGFTMIGFSGIGKTSSIDRILSLYPQIIVHSQYKGVNISMYQLTWLKLECPFDGSIKGLCMEFFIKVDSLLGTNYYKKYGIGSKIAANAMLPIIAQIARNCGIGVLIIDEIQHLNLAKSGGSEKMLNFFVTLVNTIGIPVVLIGTMKARSILQSEFRQARRGSGQGDLVWENMKNDETWKLFINGLFKFQWTKKPIELTDKMRDTLYEESQGIIDIAVKLYAMSQIEVISKRREKVTPNTIKKVAKEHFKLVRPMLKALKSGDIKKIAKYEDLISIDINEFCRNKISDMKKREELEILKGIQVSINKENIQNDILMKLAYLGVQENEAKKYLTEIKIDNSNMDIDEVVRLVYKKYIDNYQEENKKNIYSYNDSKDVVSEDKSDLRNIVDNKESSAYDVLKSNGIIKSV